MIIRIITTITMRIIIIIVIIIIINSVLPKPILSPVLSLRRSVFFADTGITG